MERSSDIIDILSQSDLFQKFAHGFQGSAGLSIALQPLENRHSIPPTAHGNAFCALMTEGTDTCAICKQLQAGLTLPEDGSRRSVVCRAGLTETIIPFQVADEPLGFFQIGHPMHVSPTQERFNRLMRFLSAESDERIQALERAYFKVPTMSPQEYQNRLNMVSIFSDHLAMLANQIIMGQQWAEPGTIREAKEFIEHHYWEKLSLSKVAHKAKAQPSYFCKRFKKVTGLHFSEYLARVRIEKAKPMLLDSRHFIRDVAVAVGFESIPYFTRVFKQITGQSPRQYRERPNS